MTRAWSEYRGRTAVVTGAASGIGRAAVELLRAAGAEVYAIDVQPIDVDGATGIAADLSDPAAIDSAVAALPSGIDALFGCAGLAQTHPPVKVVTVNYYANVRLIGGVLPKMGRGGAIATVSSLPVGWERTFPQVRPALDITDFAEAARWIEANVATIDGTGYMLSKHALIAWTILNAPRIMAEHGVRLNTLAPGKTETPMMDDFRRSSVAADLEALPVPAARLSTPEEQAHALMFLNSDLASYLVGAVLPNDGGSAAALVGGFLQMPPQQPQAAA